MPLSLRDAGQRTAALAAALLLALAAPAMGGEQVASLSAQGQDGCYFGECPEPGTPAPTLPPEQSGWPEPQQTPWPEPEGPQQGPQSWPQQASTAICQTPAFWCVMGETGPVGADCWCADWYGYVYYGITVPQ